MLPTSSGSMSGDVDFEIMPSIKKVMDYGRLTYYEALELPCDVFKLMLKNAIVDGLKETEEGRDYLAKCERLNKTTPDIAGLKRKANK